MKKRNTKDHIIETAIMLLGAYGEHGTPMSLIPKEADCGMGTIYNYVTNKEDLINSCYLYIRNLQKQEIQLLADQTQVKNILLEFCKNNMMYMIKNPDYIFFLNQFHYSPILRNEVKTESMELFSLVLHAAELGQHQEILKNLPLSELFTYDLGGICGFIAFVLVNKIEPSEEMIQNQLALTWDILKCKGQGKN